jgi:membrane associated rhomboid family serine protease
MKRVACGVLIAAAISGSVMPASAGDGFSTGMAAAVGAVGALLLGAPLLDRSMARRPSMLRGL